MKKYFFSLQKDFLLFDGSKVCSSDLISDCRDEFFGLDYWTRRNDWILSKHVSFCVSPLWFRGLEMDYVLGIWSFIPNLVVRFVTFTI